MGLVTVFDKLCGGAAAVTLRAPTLSAHAPVSPLSTSITSFSDSMALIRHYFVALSKPLGHHYLPGAPARFVLRLQLIF